MCENLGKDWVRVWNDEQKIPYAHNKTDWVSYDDLESLKIKVRLLLYLR
jgi:GH18 family chitinase